MISRPTTAQLVDDVRRELTQVLLPALGDGSLTMIAAMLDQVLSSVAQRCSHEIAWMHDESESMMAFARDVAAEIPGDQNLDQALQMLQGAPRSLHLGDVVQFYDDAGRAFSAAIDAVAASGHERLLEGARRLLDVRMAREGQIDVDWTPIGR